MATQGFAPAVAFHGPQLGADAVDGIEGLVELAAIAGATHEERELVFYFVWRDIKVRYKQTAVGVLWVSAHPGRGQYFGARLLVGPPFLTAFPHVLELDPATGRGTAAVRLTNRDPRPAGLELFLQAAYPDAAATRGFALSNGLSVAP